MFVMVMSGVLFEVWPELLNIMYTSFGFKGLITWVKLKYVTLTREPHWLKPSKLQESTCKNKAYQLMVKKLQNKIMYYKKTVTSNILGRKSEEVPLSYCQIGSKLEAFYRWGSPANPLKIKNA
jgi:hypothetical protein